MTSVRYSKFLWALYVAIGSSTSGAAADILWGVNGHPIVSYSGVSVDDQLDLIQSLNLRSYRIDIYTLEQMDKLTALLAAAKARGIAILPVLIPSVDLDQASTDELYSAGFRLAAGYVERFGADISVWELGNEMENYALLRPCEMRDDGTQYPCEWGVAAGVGPLDYYGPRYAKVAATLRGLSEGVRSVSATARRAIGTAGWGHLGIFDRLRNDGVEWDISVWHMYGEDPEEPFRHLVTFGKPIWVTEFNSPHVSENPEEQQALGLTRWMGRLRELADTYNIEAAHIYELLDEPYWQPSYEAYMGLYRLTPRPEGGWEIGPPKPSSEAVRQAIGVGDGPESR